MNWNDLKKRNVMFTTNYKCKIVISYNLNLSLKLLFLPPVTVNNNLSLRICCENIVDIAFLFKKITILNETFKILVLI